MIQQHCFSRGWMDSKRGELAIADSVLLEKCIYALQLLGQLAGSELDFVFKGGTSMILLLERLRRLSVDIDIATEAPEATSLEFLKNLARNTPFTRVEPDDRGGDRLPHRSHFKFFYSSVTLGREDYVILDVLQEGNLYPATGKRPIITPLIETERTIEVLMPTVDALLADKLTAFAPDTVGVKLTDRSKMQVIKQVVDVGELFAQASDLALIRETYAVICEAEIGYRGGTITRTQALDDTIEHARLISEIGLLGASLDPKCQLFDRGLTKMAGHLIGEPFKMENLKVAAARAASIAALIRNPDSPLTLDDIRFDPARVAELQEVQISLSQPLNRLKATNPEAFFYWHKVDMLLRQPIAQTPPASRDPI